MVDPKPLTDDDSRLDVDLDEEINYLQLKIEKISPIAGRYARYLEMLQQRLAELKSLRAGDAPRDRYVNLEPGAAAHLCLRDAGHPLTRDEIIESLIAGGCARDKSRPVQAVSAGLTQVINRSQLLERAGRVWLPEWMDNPTFAPYAVENGETDGTPDDPV